MKFICVQIERGTHPSIGWAVQAELNTYEPNKVKVAAVVPRWVLITSKRDGISHGNVDAVDLILEML